VHEFTERTPERQELEPVVKLEAWYNRPHKKMIARQLKLMEA
jgi:hypothetical protein